MDLLLAFENVGSRSPRQRARCANTGRFVAWAKAAPLRAARHGQVIRVPVAPPAPPVVVAVANPLPRPLVALVALVVGLVSLVAPAVVGLVLVAVAPLVAGVVVVVALSLVAGPRSRALSPARWRPP
jgi:hypothetical protein